MANTTSNYNVNYEDKRFAEVESAKQDALTNVENTYGGMINSAEGYYNSLIDESKAWAEEQKKQQQAQTDFTLDKIEQQKAQANKEYVREQSGAYTDWQKQSNKYGVNAEQMAAAGLQNSGFSESAQVSMYNAYQNRISTARESYMLAIQNYDNSMKDAMLQNSTALAQIAHDALQKQLELALEGFQYKNNLIIEQTNKKLEVENQYYNRYQDVLAQINRENELAEQGRQFDLNYDMKIKEYEEGIRQFNEEIARLKAKDAQEYALSIQELEHKKAQLQEEMRQFNAQFEEEKRQFDANLLEEQRQYNTSTELKRLEYEESIRQFNEEIARLKDKDAQANALSIMELEYKKAQLQEEMRQFDASLLEEKRQFDSKQTTNDGLIVDNTSPIAGNETPNEEQPTIDQKSFDKVEKELGTTLSQADMARLVIAGNVKMEVDNGTIRFTLVEQKKKHQGTTDMLN